MIWSNVRWSIPLCCVNVLLEEFCVLVHHYVGSEAILYLSMCAKAVSYVAEDALGFSCVGAYAGEDGRPKF